MKSFFTLKNILITVLVGLAIGSGVVYYMFNMPHRDVQAATVDFELSADELVSEFLSNYDAANERYLDDEGESRILLLSGTVKSIEKDMNGNQVILLKGETAKAGVSATLLPEFNHKAEGLKPGDQIKVKGVVRAGARYDEDLEMYENVIVEKSNIIN